MLNLQVHAVAASHSYYDAEQRLRGRDRRACLLMRGGGCYADGEMPPVSERSAFEEYRYDALGRRVPTRAHWLIPGDHWRVGNLGLS